MPSLMVVEQRFRRLKASESMKEARKVVRYVNGIAAEAVAEEVPPDVVYTLDRCSL